MTSGWPAGGFFATRGLGRAAAGAGGVFQHGKDFLLERGAELARLAEPAARDLLAQPGQDFLRGLDAQVRGEKCDLEAVENRGVDRGLPFDDFLNPFDELCLGGADGLFEPVEKSSLLLFAGVDGLRTHQIRL